MAESYLKECASKDEIPPQSTNEYVPEIEEEPPTPPTPPNTFSMPPDSGNFGNGDRHQRLSNYIQMFVAVLTCWLLVETRCSNKNAQKAIIEAQRANVISDSIFQLTKKEFDRSYDLNRDNYELSKTSFANSEKLNRDNFNLAEKSFETSDRYTRRSLDLTEKSVES